MKHTKFFVATGLFLLSLSSYTPASAQASYYYYYGSQKSFTVSTKVMFVKFAPSVSQATRQAAINSANVILLNNTSSGIPDIAMLKSKWISDGWWVRPCDPPGGGQNKGTPNSNNNSPNANQPLIKNNQAAAVKAPGTKPIVLQPRTPIEEALPVPKDYPPGHPCAPYYQDASYDNFYTAMSSFQANANVISASNAIIKGADTIATAEDFYIKIKPGYSIANFATLLSSNTLTAALASGEFGAAVYKISTNRPKSYRCVEFANTFYQTNMCDMATPNFYFQKAFASTDQYYNSQWGLKNTGQPGYSIVGADIRAEDAWAFTTGSSVKYNRIICKSRNLR